jgi:uridine phosphorylase
MMQRDVHLKAADLLDSLQFRKGDFAKVAIVSGQPQRAKMVLENLEKPVKNFTFLGYTFWTGFCKGKKITVGNGGFYAPDSAFITEMLCEGGVEILIRIGSCGALKEEIEIGDFVVAERVLRGDGATRYYVDDDFSPTLDKDLTQKLTDVFSKIGKVHQGGVWTTDALFRETKEIVNSYIEKGAIAVDMVSSPFATISNLYKKRVAIILVVSDNLITGELGFTDFRFFEAEMRMTKEILKVVEDL